MKSGVAMYNNAAPVSQIHLLGKIKCWCHVKAIPHLINQMILVMFSRKGPRETDSYTKDLLRKSS